MLQLLFFTGIIAQVFASIVVYKNVSYPMMPGLEPMSSDKSPHFSVIESVSKTHRHKRQVIAGPIYEWQSQNIPYQIWGGDGGFFLFLVPDFCLLCNRVSN